MILEKILLVDDEPHLSGLTAISLRLAGLTGPKTVIEETDRAESALRMLKQDSFDLVITDYRMVGQNGFELAQQIRRDISAKLPIIVLSSFPIGEVAERHLRNGTINGYLEKQTHQTLRLHGLAELVRSLFQEDD